MEPEERASYRPPGTRKTTRRDFIRLALGLGGAVAVGALTYRIFLAGGSSEPDGPVVPEEGDYLDAFNRNIVSGGPPKDGIPSIDNPRFIPRDQADSFLRPEDIVFGISHNGVVRAYPQRVLVWHEIVNDSLAGEELSITYCPLTGSQVAFRRRLRDGSVTTFGTTGKLVNSNLLMYDRLTDSNWPQILGIAINGPRRAQALEEVPLVWTTWQRWRDRHPDSEVLSPDTGYIRNYSQDPYGTYVPELGGYYASNSLFFPVMRSSDRFPSKKVFIGLRVGEEQLAVPLEEFKSVVLSNASVGGTPLVLLYDDGLDTIRAFRREVEDEILTFALRDGRFVDEETASEWSPEGVALEGPFKGTVLEQVNAFNVMWFAWYAFYPDTKVLL
jgi:hypothetical protein